MLQLTSYFYYFLIYAFLGYICEVVYVALCTKKITNRGYLYGPVVPIYGVGAILMILILQWVYQMSGWYWGIIVFILGFLITSLLEYLTSFVMEMIFHMRWWDYSNKFMNINGRVCLRNSSMFGALVVLVMYVIHPYVAVKSVDLIAKLGDVWFYVIAGILLSGFIVDFIFSTIKHVSISKIIRKLEAMAQSADAALKEKAHEASEKLEGVKENITEKRNEVATVLSGHAAELKKYFEDNAVTRAMAKVNAHYPSLRVRNMATRERQSFSEFMAKIKNVINSKDEERK